MKTLSIIAAAALAVSSTTAMAGNTFDTGTSDEMIIVPTTPAGSSSGSLGSLGGNGGAIAAGVVGLAVIAAIASSGGS